GVRPAVARATLPKGYTTVVGNDTSGVINASINSTYHELFIVSIVVAVIVMLFLGKLNTAIAVILAIPIALSASPILYRFCGFTLNLVSLLALISAIGIVVDDSIVVAENVERYRSMGLSLRESVLKGASEVFSAVVAATLSLLSVLIPVSFMGGFIGSYIRQFALGLAAAVAFSLLEALLFLTVRLAYTKDTKPFAWPDFLDSFRRLRESMAWGLKSMKKPLFIVVGVAILAVLALTRRYLFMPAVLAYPFGLGLLYYFGRILLTLLQSLTTTLHGWTEAVIGWVRDAYVRTLRRMLKQSVWVLVGAAAFLVVTIAILSTRIVFSFIPQSDTGTMEISLTLPTSTPIEVTNEVTNRFESYLLGRPDVQTVQAVVASSGRMSNTKRSYTATLDVTLVEASRRASIFTLQSAIKKDLVALIPSFPTATVQVRVSGGPMSEGSSITMNVSSSNFDLLQSRDGKIVEAIRANPWVLDATSGLSDSSYENVFAADSTSLEGTGISPSDLSTTMQIATTGTTAATVQKGGTSYDITVKVDPTSLTDAQSLLNLPVYSSTLKSNVQVGQLGHFTLSQAATSVTRYNRIYYVQYTINLKQGAPPALTFQNQLADELTKKGLLTGDLSVGAGSSTGATALSSQMQTQAPLTFLLAVFLAYLVMGAQFNSWRYPLYLLLPVPIALVGALWMVVIKGGGLDIFGLMGMLMLIGLSAKNAILYLDFVTERIGKMPFEEALVESGALRFRPIVMTTLTVLVTSFPLIFGKGTGSEFGQGLGVVTFGGIILSAVLTFFVVPAAFYMFEKKRVAQRSVETAVATVGDGASGS
ncbi:MAG TPA: efflux RND transporter permease subunit, partial [Spirochaetia bacterium]